MIAFLEATRKTGSVCLELEENLKVSNYWLCSVSIWNIIGEFSQISSDLCLVNKITLGFLLWKSKWSGV